MHETRTRRLDTEKHRSVGQDWDALATFTEAGGSPPAARTRVDVKSVERMRETGLLTPRAPLQAGRVQEVGSFVSNRAPADIRFARLPDTAPIPIEMRQPETARRVLEIVIGADDRIQVSPTSDNPWRWICMLRIQAADNSSWVGTGWLAGPRLIATAGHVVYIGNRGGWVKHIEVIPGADGVSRPFGSALATRFRTVTGWIEGDAPEFDYGAILLPDEVALGSNLGFFGYGAAEDAHLVGAQISLSGYPSDKPTGTQWHHARELLRLEPRFVYYNIDTTGGQSGSPIWTTIAGKRYVVGIHTGGMVTGNSAVRLVSSIHDNLRRWNLEA